VNKINLITPPDRLYNNDYSFLLIYPSTQIKEQFNNLIANFDQPCNLYMYEVESDEHDPDWLLGLAKQANCVILDIDNCPQNITALAAYFIANTNTYWLTSGEQLFYNKISSNRIYNLDSIVHGGTTFEKE
tara:strand:- start:316 stop:708 length:393 start_codon:yes stop_codon:yes gene_type:complete